MPAAHHQERRGVAGRERPVGAGTRDGEALFQQRIHGGPAGIGIDGLGAGTFVQDDAEGAIVEPTYSSQQPVVALLSIRPYSASGAKGVSPRVLAIQAA